MRASVYKQEIWVWLISAVIAAEIFDNSHTFVVVPQTYIFGAAFLVLTFGLTWLKFDNRFVASRPR